MYIDTALGLCVDVSGPDGNVFAIWGLARDLAKQLDRDPEVVMMALRPKDGSYDDVLDAFEKQFPMVTLLNRTQDMLDDEVCGE